MHSPTSPHSESAASAPAQLRASPAARKAAWAATIGNTLESYDWAVYSFFAALLSQKFFAKGDPVAALLSTFAIFGIGFLARPVGSLFFGPFGDRYGRKPALVLSMVLMAIGTVLVGIIPTYATIGIAAPALLLAARVIQGFANGGEFGGSTAFLVEWAPENRRGFFGSLQQLSSAGGVLLGSAIAATITSVMAADALSAWGWRIPFLLGAVLGLAGQVLRSRVEETPAFRTREEKAAPPETDARSSLTMGLQAFGVAILWTACYYVLLNYMPTFTRTHGGLTASQALWSNTIGLVIATALMPVMGALSDRIGRKPALGIATVALIVLPAPFLWLMLETRSFGLTIVLQAIFAVCIALFSGAAPAAMAEIFPTRKRFALMSISYALCTAVFGGFAPLIVTWMIQATGLAIAPALYIMGAALLTLVAIISLRETAAKTLR